jgi:hypothetical protein
MRDSDARAILSIDLGYVMREYSKPSEEKHM